MLSSTNQFDPVESPLWWAASKFVRRKSAIRLTHSDLCALLYLDRLIEKTGLEHVHVNGLMMLQCYAFGYKITSARRIVKSLMDRGLIVCQDGKFNLRGNKPKGIKLTAQGVELVVFFKSVIADRLDKFGAMFGDAVEQVKIYDVARNRKGLPFKYASLGRGSLYLDAQLYK